MNEKIISQSLYYRTKDGKADYHFLFTQVREGDGRAYIIDQPSYGNCSTCLHSTLRLKNRKGLFVATILPIKTLDKIKTLAARWADFTQEYIRNGHKNYGQENPI